MPDFSFAKHVKLLTVPLREKYGFWLNDCVLRNDVVRLRFAADDSSYKWVVVLVSYYDPSVFFEHAGTYTFTLQN